MIEIPIDSHVCSTCRCVKHKTSFDKGRKQCKECRKLYNAKQYKDRKVKKEDSTENKNSEKSN